jgi:hypothetical protein
MKKTLILVLAAGALALPAIAQETKPAEPATQAPAETPKPTWSDPEFEAVAKMLTGSFEATVNGANGPTAAVLSAAPVVIAGVPNAMYAEVAVKDTLQFPYRQTIWQFHRTKGELRLKVLEFRRAKGFLGSAAGVWAVPAAFPAITMEDLVPTLDLVLSKSGAGYAGKNTCNFPNATGGASEMTSEIKIGADSIALAERGIDDSGNVVWGPKAGESYAFKRIESPLKAMEFPNGLWAVEYPGKPEGEPAKQGQTVSVHYVGYVGVLGRMFDSSYERGTPFEYGYGQPLIEGWNIAMKDVQKGIRRRIFVPGALAFGERGKGRDIPPNSQVVFDIDVLDVKTPPPPTPPPSAQPAAQPPEQPPQQPPQQQPPQQQPPQQQPPK